MLAQFSVWPLDRPHMSEDITEVNELLNQFNVNHQVGPMGTTIEGDWQQVMAAVEACHNAVREKHERVLTSITLDDARGPQSMSEATAKVQAGSK